MSDAQRVAFFGGTFDPPHYGHLVAAQEAAHQLGLERVLFLPAAQPPHKRGQPCSPAALRCRMVELAIAENPTFQLSRLDLDRGGPSYTVDLLAHARQELGPGPSFYFLVGMDSLHDLPTWHQPAILLERCVLVAVSRPGRPELDPRSLEAAVPGAAERIVLLRTPGVDISSTELRERVAAGQPIRYLVPDAVCALIALERLYRSGR